MTIEKFPKPEMPTVVRVCLSHKLMPGPGYQAGQQVRKSKVFLPENALHACNRTRAHSAGMQRLRVGRCAHAHRDTCAHTCTHGYMHVHTDTQAHWCTRTQRHMCTH